MEGIEKLLISDLVMIGTVPIGASRVDPEAVDAQAEIGINEIIYERSAKYAREKENRFIHAIPLLKIYKIVQTPYGIEASFESRTHVLMKPYTAPENT